MSDVLKVTKLTICGLIIAIIVYPFLHESGHSLFAVIVGADILEFNLLPVPNVLCNIGGITIPCQIIIGAGGLLLPIITSACIHSKHFWIWYGNLILLGIEILSVIISVIAIISFDMGNTIMNEDITTMMNIAPNYKVVYLVSLMLLLSWSVICLVRQRPLAKMISYLEK